MAVSENGPVGSNAETSSALSAAVPITQTSSNASTVTLTAASKNDAADDEWACRCLNVRIRVKPEDTTSSRSTDAGGNGIPSTGQPASLSQDGKSIQVAFPFLTTRENVSLADSGLTLACTRCLNCSALVYGATRPAPPGPARTFGFLPAASSSSSASITSAAIVAPPESPSRESAKQSAAPSGSSVGTSSVRASSRDARSYEPYVRPLNGQIVLLPDALSPKQAREAQKSHAYSPAFRVLVQRDRTAVSSSDASTSTLMQQPPPAHDVQAQNGEADEPESRNPSTPSRPAILANRRSSAAPMPSAAVSYTLPAVPSHLITSPVQSPRVGGGGAAGASGSRAASSSLLTSAGLGHPLAAMLDTAAVERLRDFRAKAEAEVFELVRQKRREMEALEKRTMEEAEALLEASRNRRPPGSAAQQGPGSAQTSSLSLGRDNLNGVERGRGRGSSVAAPEGVQSRDFASAVRPAAPSSSSTTAQHSSNHGYPGIGDHEHDHDQDLPPVAFERRSTSTGAKPAAVSSSLSALSASFAMRGRDPPSQLEDWASKRRLRERYPEGDHSALPSAVNSTANSQAESESDNGDEIASGRRDGVVLRSDRSQRTRQSSSESFNSEDEAELADRGRGRGRGTAPPTAAPAAPSMVVTPTVSEVTDTTAAEQPGGRGRQGRGSASSQLAPPGMSASFKAKAAASVLVDDGKKADPDAPQVGGRLVSPQSAPEPSGEVTLRPRNPPPSNTEPLKPATRAGNAAAAAGSSAADPSAHGSAAALAPPAADDKRLKPRRSAEKKVAFAETEDTVDNDVLSAEEDENLADGEDADGGRGLVDETDAALFEIDEEAEGNGDEDALTDTADADGATAGDGSGIRRGASGRVRGQGDDLLLGDDDEDDHETDQATTDQDDDSYASPDEQTPGFGAASFSAMAARESVMTDLAASLARADDSGFDPASLRLDGRVVPESAAGFNDGSSDAFIVGSASAHGYRGSFRPASISRGRHTSVADAGQVHQQTTPSPPVSGSVAKRSGSKTRTGAGILVGKKEPKDEADTELRLSAAPNAPSHRSLWASKDSNSQKSGRAKYLLDEEDDQKWAAWQRKIRESKSSAVDNDDAGLGRSVPMNVAPPARFLAAAADNVGGRSTRGPALGNRTGFSSTAGDLDSPTGSSASGSASAISISMSRRGSGAGGHGYGSFYDSKSGFEREPKTSLPYNERLLVPSLRKAIRRSQYEQMSKLETIQDGGDAEVPPNTAATSSIVKPGAIKAEARAGGDSKVATPTSDGNQHALPGSVVTKGFALPGAAGAKAEDRSTPSFSYRPLSVIGGVDAMTAPPAAVAATAALNAPPLVDRTVSDSLVATMKEAGVGTAATSGTGTSTPASVTRRSPRPPYERPPPPSSYSIVLDSDPAMAPKPLKVFSVEADRSFSLYERDEEEETDEGWQKTLQFLHTIEKLKTNPRTGWLHHRVRKPESIADHMYRMGLMALLLPAEADVDLGKCVMLALVHDLAEAEVGDLTPLDRVPKQEKMRREHEAILYFAHDLLGSSAAGLRIEALWNEYEERKTKESKLVKDLDRFELCLQAVEYERREGINDLQPFYEGSLPEIRHPRVRRWAVELARERQQMWAERGINFDQPIDEQ